MQHGARPRDQLSVKRCVKPSLHAGLPVPPRVGYNRRKYEPKGRLQVVAPYITTLGDSFPYAMEVPVDTVKILVDKLLQPSGRAPNGSSFAVTSDAKQGHRRIWLSEVSMAIVADELDYLQREAP